MTKRQLSPADAREVLERTLWFVRRDGFDVPSAEPDPSPYHRSSAEVRFDAARVHMLRAAVSLAEFAGDVALLPLVLEAHVEHTDISQYFEARCDHDVFSSAIATLLALGAPVTDEVRQLAADPDAAIRLALVTGLKDAAVEFEPLIRSLADDPDAEVRATVKKALEVVGAPPWWVGLFSRDPALVLGPDEAVAFGPKLARWAELVTQRYLHEPEQKEVYALLDAMPDVLARDAVIRLMNAERSLWDAGVLARRLARIPDAIDSVIALTLEGRDYRQRQFLDAYVAIPSARTEVAARRVFAALSARSEEERGDPMSAAWRLSELLRRLWPDNGDATDLVDQVMAEADAEDDQFKLDAADEAVAHIAARSPACIARFRTPALEAFLHGKPPVWRRFHALTGAVLASLELEPRRAFARTCLGGSDTAASWGLTQLLGEAHDPERDPAVEELFVTLCADQRLRGLLVHQKPWVRKHPDLFRAELRADRLSFGDATALISNLARSEELVVHAWIGRAWERDDGLPLRLSAVVTDDDAPGVEADDWAAWRRARETAPHDRKTVHQGLFVLPWAPLCAEDRAYVMAVIARIREGDDAGVLGCAVALMVGGTEADLPLMNELVLRDADSVTELRDRMKRRLGLVSRPVRGNAAKGAKAAAPDAPKEWMDEDD